MSAYRVTVPFILVVQWEKGHFKYNFDVRNGKIFSSWFGGAMTNIAYNCLDRHIEAVSVNFILVYWSVLISTGYCTV